MFQSLKPQLGQGVLLAPGVFDGLSSLLANQAGFQSVYASGGAIARSMGRPDIGLLTMSEVLTRVKEITAVSKVPVIADADTGYGNELNVVRTVEEFFAIGVSAIHLEDQVMPKRCGHLQGKSLITRDEMCIKLRAAVKARPHPEFLLIARTDAIAVEGFAAALERVKSYMDCGVDMIFVEAPTSHEQITRIAALPYPKLLNLFYGGKTPMVPIDELKNMGFDIVIIPSDLQRAAIAAMQKTLHVIMQDGNSQAVQQDLVSFEERERIIGTARYLSE